MNPRHLCYFIAFSALAVILAGAAPEDGSRRNEPPPPMVKFPEAVDAAEPLLLGEKGILVVRTMPSSWNAVTGDVQPYAWPGRSLPIWGNVAGGIPPYTYEWDFGDGSPVVAGAVGDADYIYAYHSYVLIGAKFATLTVTDALGTTASSTVRIDVDFDTQPVRTNAAIEDGLRYLYLHQNVNGSWNSSYPMETSASAVVAFEVRGHLPTVDPNQNIYAERVQLGLDYLFANLATYMTIPATHEVDGAAGNGIGLFSNSSYSGYAHGMIMHAIASSLAPDRFTTTGSANVLGRTYRQVLTDMVDMAAWSQQDTGYYRGGWRYTINNAGYGTTDNSVVQWVSIGLSMAEREFGIFAPAFVKTELNIWLDTSRNANCGYGYSEPSSVNLARTGSGIYSRFYIDDDRSTVEPGVDCSAAWLCDNWFWSSSSEGMFNGNLYAMYAVKKAFEDYKYDFDPTCGRNWEDDFQKHLVKGYSSPSGYDSYHQTTDTGDPVNDGRWANYDYWTNSGGTYMTSAYALLILAKGNKPCEPEAVIDASTDRACPGVEICFDGSGSFINGVDCTNEIVLWEWDLDNDGTWEATGQYVCKPEGYPLPPGEEEFPYTVKLKVTDDQGGVDITTGTVTIGTAPPVAVPGGPYTACVGEPIFLNGCGSFHPGFACSGDSIVTYGWDFEPDGVIDLYAPDCVPDTFLVFQEEVFRNIQLRVQDSRGVWSDPGQGVVEVWSSLRELSVAAADMAYDCLPDESIMIEGTVRAGTQEPGLMIPAVPVHFYYDDPADPLKRIAEFTTPEMTGGDSQTFSFAWTPSDPLLTYEIYMVVDPNGIVRECVETDNTAMMPVDCAQRCVEVVVQEIQYSSPQLVIPVSIANLAGQTPVTGIDFILTYDPAVVRPTGVDLTGTILDGLGWMSFVNIPAPGEVRMGVAGTVPLPGDGALVFIEMEVVEAAECNACTFLHLDVLLNEGDPCVDVSPIEEFCRPMVMVAGTVNFWGCAQVGNAFPPIPDVMIVMENGQPDTTMTDAEGAFTLAACQDSCYSLIPSKPCGEMEGISPLDASLVLRHFARLAPLDACPIGPEDLPGGGQCLDDVVLPQRVAADVTGNGEIHSFDAAIILRYLVGQDMSQYLVGCWKFYCDRLEGCVQGEEVPGLRFGGLLYGDVSGNYGAAEPVAVTASSPAAISALSVHAEPGTTVEVPVVLTDADGFYGLQFEIGHDPAFVTVQSVIPADLAQGCLLEWKADADGVRVAVASAEPISGTGRLCLIRYYVSDSAPVQSCDLPVRNPRADERPEWMASVAGMITTGVSGVGDQSVIPEAFRLLAPTPNPFNPMTRISFEVPAGGGMVRLDIYDISGRLVRHLHEGELTPGLHQITWTGVDSNGKQVASGTYLVLLSAPGYVSSEKITLIK